MFPSAEEDVRAAQLCPMSPQTLSSAYRLAYTDPDFLLRDELRPVRLQLELLKTELILNEHGIEGTIVIFTLTLIQTQKIRPFPVLIFGKAFWERIINFEALVEEGTIAPEDVDLLTYVETAEEAWDAISRSCRLS